MHVGHQKRRTFALSLLDSLGQSIVFDGSGGRASFACSLQGGVILDSWKLASLAANAIRRVLTAPLWGLGTSARAVSVGVQAGRGVLLVEGLFRGEASEQQTRPSVWPGSYEYVVAHKALNGALSSAG